MKIEYEEALAILGMGEYSEGISRMKELAENGYIPAQTFLGDCYLTGQYAEKNYSTAIQWYSKAAACDDAYSQRMIGTMYLEGRGVAENREDAFRWFQLSAENGDMLGQFYTAEVLYGGIGTDRDYEGAKKWYTLAADQGHGDSCKKLGDMYSSGLGSIRQDIPRAIKYFQLAAKNGLKIAQEQFEDLYREELEVRIGKTISQGLTQAQLKEFDLINDSQEASKWLDNNRPDYKTIVNEIINEMEFEFPLLKYQMKKSDKSGSNYSDVNDVFEKHKNDELEQLLDAIEEFFISEGKQYRGGRLSEKEYYLKTDSRRVLQKLWKMKGNCIVKLPIVKDYNKFVQTFSCWKETNDIVEKPWMRRVISSDMGVTESVDWVFRVIDVLRIPMCYLTSIETDDYPALFYRIRKDELTACLAEKCIDIKQLTEAPDPVGKEYLLHFDKGTTMQITVEDKINGDYFTKGIIDNYMRKSGDVFIEIDNDEAFVYFNKQTIDPLQGLWGTYLLPNLNDKWDSWNKSRLEYAYLFEMEYKSLRNPYMTSTV